MNIPRTFARAALATAFILAAATLRPGESWAQADMKDMPGMAPKTTPAPKKSAPAATPKPAAASSQAEMEAMPGMPAKAAPTSKEAAPTVTTPTAAAAAKAEMDAMPGMSPAKPPAGKSAAGKDGMAGMPGMAAGGAKSKKAGMAGMPGMAPGGASSKKGGMAGMPGMPAGGASAPTKMSAPGVTILGPSRKWVPPRGENRAAELLSRPMLEEHLGGLPAPVEDSMIHSFVLAEILEYRVNSEGPETLRWDIYGWIGGDRNRLWIKTEGSQQLGGDKTGEGDLQLLYGRLIAPFWDFQIGARVQQSLGTGARDSRTYAVLGVQGVAPYLFDVEPSLFISDRGDVSARLTVSFDWLLTQKLVLQPRFEANAALQADEKLGVGEGVNDTELGLRLRYEIRREFAPYIGVTWQRRYGETARFAESEGDSSEVFSFVLGLRLWW